MRGHGYFRKEDRMNRFITCWSTGENTGRGTLMRHLADHLTDQKSSVLLMNVGFPCDPQDNDHSQDPSDWVPRFKTLSPKLLRNFLAGPPGAYARLSLPTLPERSISKDLLPL